MSIVGQLFKVALTRAKSRITTPFLKDVMEVVKGEFAEQAVFKGQMNDALFKIGVYGRAGGRATIKGKDLDMYSRAFFHGNHYAQGEVLTKLQNTRKLFDFAWDEVQKAGGTVQEKVWEIAKDGSIVRKVKFNSIGKIPEYSPRYLKRGWAEAFTEDGDRAFKYIAKKTDDYSIFRTTSLKLEKADMLMLNEFVNKHMGKGGLFKEETKKALNHLINRDKISPAEALVWIRDRGNSQLTSPFAVLRHSRKMNLMLEAYEDDALKAIDTYFRGWAKHLSALRAWGPKFERKLEAFTKAGKLEGVTLDEIKVLERLSEMVDGIAEYKYTSKGFRKFSKMFTEIEVTTKIGLGTAFIPNIFQILISTIPKVGFINAVKAAARWTGKEGQSLARGTGIHGRKYLALELMAGMPDDMAAGSRLTDALITYNPGMRLFQWVNRQNNIYSALAGEQWFKSLYRRSIQGNKYAIRTLEEWGLNPKKLPDRTTMQKSMWEFATKMQLQRNPFEDPLWMNDPRFRFLALFKRFGYRQSAMIYDEFVKEIGKGNVLPLLRLGATGVAGGALSYWTKEAIRREIFKAPDWDDSDVNPLQQIGFMVAQGGAFGMVGDIVGRARWGSAEEITRGLFDNTYFATAPIFATEIFGVPGSRTYTGWPALAKQFFVDWSAEGIDLEGFKASFAKHAPSALKRVSPMGAYPAATIKEHQKINKKRQKLAQFVYGR